MMVGLALALTIRGLAYNGPPPVRYQRDVLLGRVALVSNLTDYCGHAPPTHRWGGCYDAKTHIVFIENPCQVTGMYAKRLCHELGHANGWSRYHEF